MCKGLAMRKLTAIAIVASLPLVGLLEGCAANRTCPGGACGAPAVYDDGTGYGGQPVQQPSSGPVRRMLEGSTSR